MAEAGQEGHEEHRPPVTGKVRDVGQHGPTRHKNNGCCSNIIYIHIYYNIIYIYIYPIQHPLLLRLFDPCRRGMLQDEASPGSAFVGIGHGGHRGVAPGHQPVTLMRALVYSNKAATLNPHNHQGSFRASREDHRDC